MIRSILLGLLVAGCSGRWAFVEENDYFTALNNDNSYTQGVELSREHENRRVGMSQRIYTPASKRLSPAPQDQRPYAATIVADIADRGHWQNDTRLTKGARGGVIGPSALGQEAQCGVHALLGQYCPAGWGDQIRDELTGSLYAKVEHRGTQELWALSGERLAELHLEAGTLWSGIKSSTRMRWELGPFYFWAGPGAMLVLRDITLDGNTFRDSRSVKKEWLVSELSMGLGVDAGTSIEWFLTLRTPEFKGQGVYHFGGIKIAWGK
jgi:lipid A 3-O-deacylase